MRLSLFARLDAEFAPAPSPDRVAFLTRQPFAHRGLHGLGPVENSRAAFDAAIDEEVGIELDVRLTRDGGAAVFHDAELQRLTGTPGRVIDASLKELANLPLAGSPEAVPSLGEVLLRIAGRAPLLIEMKVDEARQTVPLCLAVRRALEGYRGEVAVMSFDAAAVRWFADNAAQIVRGLVVSEGGTRWRTAPRRRLALWRARPDFLAYDVRDLPSAFVERQRRRGFTTLAWTVRGPMHEELARRHADAIIYERG